MNRRFPGSILALIFLLTCGLAAQEKAPFPVEALLAGPDHADMPWKVQFLEPILMYQQQYVLEIRTRISADIVDDLGPSGVMHFAAKVADANGRWLPGIQYNHFEPVAKLGKTKDIECALAIYLRPGEYTVAMVIFANTTSKSNIVRSHIVIPPLQRDPLPEFDSHLPVVEFPADFPLDELSRTDRSFGELFPVGKQTSPLSIATSGKTRIDVVVNVSRQEQPASKEPLPRPEREYRPFSGRSGRPDYRTQVVIPHGLALARVLQTSSVLSRLGLTNGCVQVSAIDPLHMRTVQAPKPAAEIDWPQFTASMEKLDQNTIDARVLKDHRGPGRFLTDFLEKLSADAACDNTPATTHYVIVVGTSLDLPEFNKDMRLSGAAAERARFYYFEPPSNSPYSDDVNKILKSAKSHRFAFTTPEEFRQKIAELIHDLRSASN